MYSADIKRLPRHFVPKDFIITDWENLEPFFKDLLERNIDNKEELEQWLKDMSEVEAVVNEDACWRQIKMTCDTRNKTLEDAFNFFCMEIQPKIQPYADALNKKLIIHYLKFMFIKNNKNKNKSIYFKYLFLFMCILNLLRSSKVYSILFMRKLFPLLIRVSKNELPT